MIDLDRRAEVWARARRARIAGRNPWLAVLLTARASARDRITGLAGEMAFFALLSLVPLVVAFGASLGWLELLVGRRAVTEGQEAVIDGLAAVFSDQATEQVLRPLVQGLLQEQRGGVALSSVLVALWLASRVFTATISALDQAYDVEERRGVLVRRLLAVGFAVGAVVAGSLTLVLSVLGPLLGTGRQLADELGLGDAFATAWALARWPLLLLVVTAFFAAVYRFGPNVDNTLTQALPGALLGVTLWVLVSLGLRWYLQVVGSPTARFAAGAEAAALLSVVGTIVAAVLWTYLSSLVMLIGGEFNSVLALHGHRGAAGGNGGG